MTLRKFSNLFVPLRLKTESNSNTYALGMLWGLNEWIHIKFLDQNIAHSKCSLVLAITIIHL